MTTPQTPTSSRRRSWRSRGPRRRRGRRRRSRSWRQIWPARSTSCWTRSRGTGLRRPAPLGARESRSQLLTAKLALGHEPFGSTGRRRRGGGGGREPGGLASLGCCPGALHDVAHASLFFSRVRLGKLDVILRSPCLTVLDGVSVSPEMYRNIGLHGVTVILAAWFESGYMYVRQIRMRLDQFTNFPRECGPRMRGRLSMQSGHYHCRRNCYRQAFSVFGILPVIQAAAEN